jgi:hypothetical protein
MLEECAKGFGIRRTTHGKPVEYGGKVYLNLPKHNNIEIGHIRKLVRHLGIDKTCARRFNYCHQRTDTTDGARTLTTEAMGGNL